MIRSFESAGLEAWRARLERPPRRAGPEALPGLWRHTVLELDCRRPPAAEGGPWLAAALRGAVGRDLLERAGFPEAELARVLLFEPLGRVTAGLALPKPWVPEVSLAGPRLRLRLTLFGAAEACREPLRQALLRTAHRGFALTERGHCRPPLEVLEGRWWRREVVPLPPAAGQARLRFLTPLCLSASGPVKSDPEGLAFALLDRVSGLARWQGLRLETDWSAWRDLAKGLHFSEVALSPYVFLRRSSRQPGRTIPVRGLIGELVIDRPPAPLLPLLALGELTHAGAHAALGLGRYELIASP